MRRGDWAEAVGMAISLLTYRLRGLEALPVHVEVDVSAGMPFFGIVGMAGTSVQESKDRLRSALMASEFRFPLTRKVVNLAPAEMNKSGSHFDLPMALGLLMASKQIPVVEEKILVLGELGLDGSVRGVRGVLSALMMARDIGVKRVILPAENMAEACLLKELQLQGVFHLREAVRALGDDSIGITRVDSSDEEAELPVAVGVDFADIFGHSAAKRALMIAASGGHHILMSGPPGSGKSLLAQGFLGLLPPLSPQELLEVLRIHGVIFSHGAVERTRPFRVVHARITPFMLLGGGVNLVPGEVSLAHRGVLFMDEFAEFERRVLESLRGPLEGQALHWRSGKETAVFPCQFQLLAACNPCPCGFYGDREKPCVCSASDLARYQRRLSGPIVDRLDLCVDVPRLPFEDFKVGATESSQQLRAKVVAARERMRARLGREGLVLNQEMTPKLLKTEKLDLSCQEFLAQVSKAYALSGRAVHRLLKVSRTLADLEGSDWIKKSHLAEAVHYRLRA